MRIIFMGTPDFAVPCLEALVDEKYNVVGVFSQPDKKVGRKQILTPPEVKVCAEENNIPVFQPNTLKNNTEILETIKSLNADLLVVVAYGKILPKSILESTKYGAINVHASLLPKYRGAAPIQWAVLNGDKETGVTIMKMDEGLDTGDILEVEKTEIGINETSEELFSRLSTIGAKTLINTIKKIENNTVKAEKQPSGDFGYAKMIDKSMCAIDWNKSAFEIHNQIRGLQTWPVAITTLNGKNLKIHKSTLGIDTNETAGTIVFADGTLSVACGDNKTINILEVQLDGKKRMDTKSFLLGNKVEVGTVLGE